MKRKIVSIAFLTCLIAMLILPVASAYVASYPFYYYSGSDGAITHDHPTAASYKSAYGMNFTATEDTIGYVTVWLKQFGTSPVGTLTCYLHVMNDTDGFPDESQLIGTSYNTFEIAELDTDYEQCDFQFYPAVSVTIGNNYTFIIAASSTDNTYTKGAHIAYDSTAGAEYEALMYWGSHYSAVGTNDYLCFLISDADYNPSATGTPGPLPTYNPYNYGTGDELITTIVGYLIPLIMFLLPAGILGSVTHWKMWPIMIGLTIGAGLTYLFLGSGYIWLVFLVCVGIGFMVWKGGETK